MPASLRCGWCKRLIYIDNWSCQYSYRNSNENWDKKLYYADNVFPDVLASFASFLGQISISSNVFYTKYF
jgi:hypothetical protein